MKIKFNSFVLALFSQFFSTTFSLNCDNGNVLKEYFSRENCTKSKSLYYLLNDTSVEEDLNKKGISTIKFKSGGQNTCVHCAYAYQGVDLRHNCLMHVEQIILADVWFKKIKLDYNKISSSNAIDYFGYPDHLSLSYNYIERISALPLGPQTGVRTNYLDFSQNKIYDIEVNAFPNVVVHLNLSANSIKTLRKSTFLNTVNLKTLNLSRNKIFTLSANAFSKLRIDYLDLSYNKIMVFPHRAKIGLKGSNINVFNISHNCISTLNHKLTTGTINIDTVDLSYNKLTSFNTTLTFWIRNLNLANNKLNFFDNNSFSNIEDLKVLDLSNNDINSFNLSHLNALRKLRNLNMKHNKLPVYKLKWDLLNNTKVTVELNGNDLSCQCYGLDTNVICRNYTNATCKDCFIQPALWSQLLVSFTSCIGDKEPTKSPVPWPNFLYALIALVIIPIIIVVICLICARKEQVRRKSASCPPAISSHIPNRMRRSNPALDVREEPVNTQPITAPYTLADDIQQAMSLYATVGDRNPVVPTNISNGGENNISSTDPQRSNQYESILYIHPISATLQPVDDYDRNSQTLKQRRENYETAEIGLYVAMTENGSNAAEANT